MRLRSFTKALAILLTVILIAPSVFLIAPQKTRATWPVVEVGLQLIKSTITAVSSVTTAIATPLTAVATVAKQVNDYVLQPMAFIMSGQLLKSLTAGVLKFVTGATNGTNAPQFVQNISGHMQKVGDVSALSFLSQFGKYSNSPFKASIASSLKANYYQNTSLAGFFVANTSTLDNVTGGKDGTKAFLAGNWSNGGIGAWLALTTQDNNNPYTLYQNAQGKMASVVGSAQAARQQQLSWGQGMLSWCGKDPTGDTSKKQNGMACEDSPECQSNNCGWLGGVAGDNTTGVAVCVENPAALAGDSCSMGDGTPGEIKTPGSVITASLNKVLGGQQDKLNQIGNIGAQVGSILSSISTIMNTINLAQSILGSSSGNGLIDAGSSMDTMDYMGISPTTITASSIESMKLLIKTISTRVDQYETAWNAIKASADTASTSVLSLITVCDTNIAKVKAYNPQTQTYIDFENSATTQKNAAQTLLDSGGAIKTVLDNFYTAGKTIETARGFINKAKSTEQTSADLSGNITNLQGMGPSASDVADAEMNSQLSGGDLQTSANPTGSLKVSGGSTVDQMALISTNAKALKTSVCTWP